MCVPTNNNNMRRDRNQIVHVSQPLIFCKVSFIRVSLSLYVILDSNHIRLCLTFSRQLIAYEINMDKESRINVSNCITNSQPMKVLIELDFQSKCP